MSVRSVNGWECEGTPPVIEQTWIRAFGEDALVPPPLAYSKGDLHALVGREPVGLNQASMEDLRWHISVSGVRRLPTWEEMVDAAHSLRPGVMFCIPMPPSSMWLNVHETTLHLWQIVDPNLETQWREERQGHAPT